MHNQGQQNIENSPVSFAAPYSREVVTYRCRSKVAAVDDPEHRNLKWRFGGGKRLAKSYSCLPSILSVLIRAARFIIHLYGVNLKVCGMYVYR
jgi:hypothetical protein